MLHWMMIYMLRLVGLMILLSQTRMVMMAVVVTVMIEVGLLIRLYLSHIVALINLLLGMGVRG